MDQESPKFLRSNVLISLFLCKESVLGEQRQENEHPEVGPAQKEACFIVGLDLDS